MTTDNKTLADVQPGGRVRLGDAAPTHDQQTIERVAKAMQASEQAQSGWTWADCSPIEVEGWMDLARAAVAALSALSAQPSPGGQGNLKSRFTEWVKANSYNPATFASGRFMGDGVQIAWEAVQALAARQPVGEPEIWVSPGQLEELKRRPAGQGSNYLPTRLASEGNFTQPLYAAPPAQAVDLDELRRAVCVVNVVGQIDGHDVVRRDSMLDVIDSRRQRLADSQAVGNG